MNLIRYVRYGKNNCLDIAWNSTLETTEKQRIPEESLILSTYSLKELRQWISVSGKLLNTNRKNHRLECEGDILNLNLYWNFEKKVIFKRRCAYIGLKSRIPNHYY